MLTAPLWLRLAIMVALVAGVGAACAPARAPVERASVILPENDPYLVKLKEQIRARWIYPCHPSETTDTCDYREAKVVVEFGIYWDGALGFTKIQTSSGYARYDESVLNAIKLAAPFPPVPSAIKATRPATSTGIPIRARFNYVLEKK